MERIVCNEKRFYRCRESSLFTNQQQLKVFMKNRLLDVALPDVNQKVRTNKLALCKKGEGQMPNAKKAEDAA